VAIAKGLVVSLTRFSGFIAVAALSLTGAALAQDAPVKGGTLIYLDQQPHTNLYPPAGGFYPNGGVLNQITDKLTYQNPKTLEIEPWIADSWTVNADATEYIFKIRPGITFSDGTPLNADAVVDNLQRGLKSPLLGPIFTDVTGIAKVDDMTLTVTNSKTWVDMCSYYASSIGYMASSKWLAAVDADPTKATQPVGTGPFIMDSFKPGESTIVKRNPNYWRKSENLPHLDEIDFRIIPDELTSANALKTGELDVLITKNGQNIKDFKDDSKYNYVAQDKYTDTLYQMLNVGQDGSPLQDKDVRCGLTAATDNKTLSDVISAGQFPVATLPTHLTYCTGIGSSRPHLARVSASCCSDAPMPAMLIAGSPGSRRRKVKVSTVTAKTTITSWMSRCLT
jgi:peptide/nickel transport system substrate-binding protein